jgi:BirA family transcriptional regulator, biotin operon repressor / biotin---[acetyl-CoA-carboxylase] ligase
MPQSHPPIRWPAEAIWQAVEPQLPGFTVEVLPEIDSTNTELLRRFKSGRPEPTLLVAEQQSAGRGRLGRQWQSQRGGSLTFSLGLALQPVDWSGLSLAVGISLAESLDPAFTAHKHIGLHIGLKWPNDLWLCSPGSERKLAGILLETATWEDQRYVVIGVGINIGAPPPAAATAVPTKLATPVDPSAAPPIAPAALQELLAGIDAAATLLRVVPPMLQTVQAFAQFGFAPFQARFARRDVLAGRSVAVFDGKNRLEGSAHGVGVNGALLVHTESGMKEITSSEVSVRPAPMPPQTSSRPPC